MGDSAVRMRAISKELAHRGRHLPDLADHLELAEVEGIEADQFGGLRGRDVTRATVAQPPHHLTGALGQQACAPGMWCLSTSSRWPRVAKPWRRP